MIRSYSHPSTVSTAPELQLDCEEKVNCFGKTHLAAKGRMDSAAISTGEQTAATGEGRVRRSTRRLFGLSEEQDGNLVELLKGQAGYRGSWTTLRNSVAEYASGKGMQCQFTQEWRRAFLQRQCHTLPPVINALFSLPSEHDDLMLDGSSSVPLHEQVSQLIGDLDKEEEDTEESDQDDAIKGKDSVMGQAEEPAEWDADMRQAMQQALAAFVKAGFSEMKARKMLARMGVPGFIVTKKPTQSTENRKMKKRRGDASSKDEEFRVVQAPSRKQTSPRVSGSQFTSGATEDPSLPEVTASKFSASASKKTPLQLRVLEREYLKNRNLTSARATQLADKLMLEAEQVMAWFRGKRAREKARGGTTVS